MLSGIIYSILSNVETAERTVRIDSFFPEQESNDLSLTHRMCELHSLCLNNLISRLTHSETEFKINKKKRNIIIAIVALIVVLAGIITGLVIYNINNKPVETEEPTTETIVVDEPTEEPASTEEPTTSEEPEETEEPTEEVKPTEEPASTEEPSHTHTWSKATCTSPKTCSCGETSGSPLGHSFSNGKCSRCGAKDPNYQEPTPPAHTHSYSSKVTKEATCTSNGTITYTCSCGDSYTESTPALGHNWSNADCTHCKTCSRCGATEGSALGHDYREHTLFYVMIHVYCIHYCELF